MAFRDLRSRPRDTDNDTLRKIADSLAISLGQRGHDRYTSGTNTGEWVILHAFAASVVTITRDTVVEAGISIIAGDRLYGQITSVTVTSGDVELYRAN